MLCASNYKWSTWVRILLKTSSEDIPGDNDLFYIGL